jgi:hypothetical protein
MAGDKTSQAAVAFEALRNTRRLTDAVFMVLPPQRVFLRRYLMFAAVQLAIDHKCMTKRKPLARAGRRGTPERRAQRGAHRSGVKDFVLLY